MILHLVTGNSFTTEFCGPEDKVLLIQDGVYLTLNRATFALGADLKARGVTAKTDQVVIDYDGFVDLVAESEKVVTW